MDLKNLALGLFWLFLAGIAFFVAVDAWYQLAATGELPLHGRVSFFARSGWSYKGPFTPGYFVGVMFYALVVVIGAIALFILIDQHVGIRIAEKRRLRRVLGWLAVVSVVLPIVISLVRGSIPV